MRRMRAWPVVVLLLATVIPAAGASPYADLESPELSVRRAAARTFTEIIDTGALPELIRAVRREQDEEVRRLLILALGRIGEKRAVWDLFRHLDGSPEVALWSIRNILDGRPPCFRDDALGLKFLPETWEERTREWWKDRKHNGEYRAYSLLPPTSEQEVVLLRELRSTEERVALRAAERLDPHRLNLDELRIQASLLARHPHSWALQALGRPLGTVDFPTLWSRLAASDLTDADCQGRTHWALLPECIPVLVSLLPEANQEWFRKFVGLVGWAARDTDRFRLEAARGFAFALARFKAENPLPELAGLQVELPGPGLPAVFVTLVEARVRMSAAARPEADDPAAWLPSLPWLRRWARTLRPVRTDLPFLERIARGAEELTDRVWAVQALGRITGPAATKALAAIAKAETDTALFAAAELAKDGRPDRFQELQGNRTRDEIADMLAFSVMPKEAVHRWIENLVKPEPEASWGWRPFDPSTSGDLERIASYGIRFRREDREALAAALPVEEVSFDNLFWFLTEVSASPLNGPAVGKVMERLREYEVEEDDYSDPQGLKPLLALLEVRSHAKLVSLLHHWVEHRKGRLRDRALETLGRLGDSRFVAEMIEVWRRSDRLDWDAGWLGRVKDPHVGAFLEKNVRTGSPETLWPAMVALSVYHGLPDTVFSRIGNPDLVTGTSEPIVAARGMLLEGDTIGAVLALLDAGADVDLRELGAIDDPRVLAALKRRALDRENHWQAVTGLARAGDMDARRELAGLFDDGRTWIFFPLRNGPAFTEDLDPARVEYWIARVDATCCIGFCTLAVLSEMFPMLCVDNRAGTLPELKNLIAEWWQEHRDDLAYSTILDGWIPSR